MIRHFAQDTQGFATAGKDLEPQTIIQEVLGKSHAGSNEFLTVIKKKEELFIAQVI